MNDVLISFFLLLGSAVILLAAVGLIRLPDAVCRSHALGKAMTLGLVLVLVGLWLFLGTEAAGIKLPLAVLFQFLTIPVASHLLIRLAYRKNQGVYASKERPGEEASSHRR